MNFLLYFIAFSITVGIHFNAMAIDPEIFLNHKVQNLNQDTSSTINEEARIKALAKQFNIFEEKIAELREQKVGWGEITVRLAMAKELSVASKGPTTVEEATAKIGNLRNQQMLWGKIASLLGFYLGPIVHRTERGERTLQLADQRGSYYYQEPKPKSVRSETIGSSESLRWE